MKKKTKRPLNWKGIIALLITIPLAAMILIDLANIINISYDNFTIYDLFIGLITFRILELLIRYAIRIRIHKRRYY